MWPPSLCSSSSDSLRPWCEMFGTVYALEIATVLASPLLPVVLDHLCQLGCLLVQIQGTKHTLYFPKKQQNRKERIASQVRSLLRLFFGKQSAWTYVSGLAQTQNGQLCHQTLYQHFLGGSNSQSISLQIIKALRSLQYDGKSKNFTFNKFTAKHSTHHGSADKLENFNSLTEEMKCQLFVSGIRDPGPKPAKHT
jgi:hypothetical protein